MVTSHWRSWFQGYSPLGERMGCMTTPRWGRGGVFGLLPAGEVDLMVTPHWGSWVSGLLPAGGEGGLHDYSPLGERVGFYDHFSLGMLGFMVISEKKIKRKVEISQKDKEKSKGRQD